MREYITGTTKNHAVATLLLQNVAQRYILLHTARVGRHLNSTGKTKVRHQMQTSGVKRNRYAETELLFDSLANPGDEAVQHIALFRMRIAGDSMMPKYQSGDIIEFDLIRDGVPALEVGRDYFIHRKDNKGTFKRLATIEEATLTFVALNTEKYPEAFVVERTEIRRMAVAKGIFIPW